ncbi:hypothetical protein R1sor_009961 [Riccia sorocarpa]|uniref:GDSL esterase/lipase n=1 Tax=Riccia sorocarpa TaxID=122646 RepID=A0ABD3I0K8_9MARC
MEIERKWLQTFVLAFTFCTLQLATICNGVRNDSPTLDSEASYAAGHHESCHGTQYDGSSLETVASCGAADHESDFHAKLCCFPAIFSFGSSVADTGTSVLVRVDAPPNNFPYGRTFPGYSSGRWSDGRLLIDFWAEILGLPYLDPFVKSGTSRFNHGANFACGGGTATDKYTNIAPSFFSLSLQLYQFKKFKSQVLETHRVQELVPGSGHMKDCGSTLPPVSVFLDALYIVAAGANDIWYPVLQGTPINDMRVAIPEISASIMRTVEALHEEGARNILVEDVYPAGCMLVAIKDGNYTRYGDLGTLDSDGCVKLLDHLIQLHNAILKEEIAAFARKHSDDLSIALVDTYSIRRDLMTNPAKYGFKYGMDTCCGSDGMPGRYKSDEKCGKSPRAQPCTDPKEYVVWDGLHYTEAANKATMKAILSGAHFHPEFTLRWNQS